MQRITNTGVNSPDHQLTAWSKRRDINIFQCFEKYFSEESPAQGQRRRLFKMCFGNVALLTTSLSDDSFFKAVEKAVHACEVNPEKPVHRIAMCLGVSEYVDREHGTDDYFNILFELSGPGNQRDYFGLDDPRKGSVYEPSVMRLSGSPNGIPVPHFGIYPKTRNRFCTNWLMNHQESVPDLFNSESQLEGRTLEPGNPMGQPLDRVKKRAHRYFIQGYNLKVMFYLMKKAVDEGKTLNLDVSLGVTPADKYYNEPQFTLMLELFTETSQNNEDDTISTLPEITALDFVGGCPPACPSDGDYQ